MSEGRHTIINFIWTFTIKTISKNFTEFYRFILKIFHPCNIKCQLNDLGNFCFYLGR
jgi:hypothetical protein